MLSCLVYMVCLISVLGSQVMNKVFSNSGGFPLLPVSMHKVTNNLATV